MRSRVIADLKAQHLAALLPAVDFNLVFVGLDPKISQADRSRIKRMLDLGLPAAVFVGSRHRSRLIRR